MEIVTKITPICLAIIMPGLGKLEKFLKKINTMCN